MNKSYVKINYKNFAIAIIILSIVGCKKENQPPYISFLSPTPNQEVLRGEIIKVNINAVDEDGIVEEVRLYLDEVGISSANSFPYDFELETTEINEGEHVIKAVGFDNENLESTASVTFNIYSTTATVVTNEVRNIEPFRASMSFELVSDGGSPVTEKGVCWSETPNPTYQDEKVSFYEGGIGSIGFSVSYKFVPNTKYFYRAFAINSNGAVYGEEFEFTTPKFEIDFTQSTIWGNYYTEEIYLMDVNRNLFISYDNSETWNYISRLPFNIINELIIVGESLYGRGETLIYQSNDKGKSWISLPKPDPIDKPIRFNVDIQTKEVYAATKYALHKYDGSNWTRILINLESHSEYVAVDLNGKIYFGDYNSNLFTSEDNGQSWKTFNLYDLNRDYYSTMGSVYITNENIVLGNSYWKGIWKITDDNFLPLNNGLSEHNDLIAHMTVTLNSDYYLQTSMNTNPVKTIYYSPDRGGNWNKINNNLTEYNLRNRLYMSINNAGNVFISINGVGCFILNEDKTNWQEITN